MLEFCGWQRNEEEVDRVVSSLITPFFQAPYTEDRDTNNHQIFKQLIGSDAPNGPQKIGDCTSWGWSNGVNYTTVLEMWLQLQEKKASLGWTQEQYATAVADEIFQYEEICTEAMYGISRVMVGGQRGSRQDGAVGAWDAKAVTDYGAISRAHLQRIGLDPTYAGQRAKDWGATGPPQNVLDGAKTHLIAEVTPVRTFNDLKFHTQNYRVVPVCSDVGFETGSGGATTTRDSQGYSKPRGSWPHCMIFVDTRGGSRPAALLLNQWGDQAVNGPMGDVEIPKCSWWVDADVVEKMLKQGDSFTLSKFKGYPARKLTWRF